MRILLLPVLLLLATHALAAQGAPPKPNVIYIIVDDLGYADIGTFGSEIETPVLDRLAEEGLRFRQHYTYAKCETSRTSVMSGLFHENAPLKMKPRQGFQSVSLAEMLGTAGYRSYLSGKWHLHGNPLDRGFDGFYGLKQGASSHYHPFRQKRIYRDRQLLTSADRPEGFYTSDNFTSEAIDWIGAQLEQDREAPFFVYLAYTAPHSPLQAPPELVAKYRGRYLDGWEKVRERRIARQRELGILEPNWPASSKPSVLPDWSDLDPDQQAAEDFRMATFAAMVERVDWNIGRLVDFLQDPDGDGHPSDSVYENTLIYFVSDNGSSPYPRTPSNSPPPDDPNSEWRLGPAWAWVGNTPFRYFKQSQFNGGVLTPMIVHWPAAVPQARRGAILDYPTHVIDVMPTLAQAAGVDYAETFPEATPLDGIGILPLFLGEGMDPEARPPIGFEFGRSEHAYLEYPWKIASFRNSPWELFHLGEDRAETRNLAVEKPEKAHAMARSFREWMNAEVPSAGINRPRDGGNVKFTGSLTDLARPVDLEELYRLPGTEAPFPGIVPLLTETTVGNIPALQSSRPIKKNPLKRINTSLGGAWTEARSDRFAFYHRPADGDAVLQVKIADLQDCGPQGGAGLMLRTALQSDAPFLLLEAAPAENGEVQIRLRSRPEQGAAIQPLAEADAFLPVWLRLERVADTVTARFSPNGIDWQSLPPAQIQMPEAVEAGVALHAGNPSGQATIAWEEYQQIATPDTPAPSQL